MIKSDLLVALIVVGPAAFIVGSILVMERALQWCEAHFAGTDPVECPSCGLSAYVVDGQLGRHCSFCGARWPYPSEHEGRHPEMEVHE